MPNIKFVTLMSRTLSLRSSFELSFTLAFISSKSFAMVLFTTFNINHEFLNSAPQYSTHLIYPLKQSPTPLGCSAVAVHGMLVPLSCLHVGEDVGGGLVECGHLCRGTVGKLYIAEVVLGSLDVLSCSNQVVTSNACYAVSGK